MNTEEQRVDKDAPALSKETFPAGALDGKTMLDNRAKTEIVDAIAPLSVGDTLGKYEIRGLLGRGGMGCVYLAYDPMIEREVAVKVLPPEVASKPETLRRFLDEAKATGKLNHPNVVAIYDIGQHENLYYIVMELLGGGSVADLLTAQGALPWRDACRIASDAAAGLAAAHAAGLLHRDIKPENLMLGHDGVVKVVDFGLSKLVDSAHDTRDTVTKVGQILGTPQYMSPEQFQAQKLDARSDIYSLGATFYRVLSGKLPFENCASIMQVMYAHLEQPPPDPTLVVSDAPQQCAEIIARAMAKSPNDRFQGAGEMASQLRALFADRAPTVINVEEVSSRPLKSVLIVEPAKLPALMLQDALDRAGATLVEVCRNATDAIERLEAEAADVVVTAMQLPDESGIELIEQLRQRPRYRQSMLILNSSDSTMDDLLAAGRSGALALVSKKTKPDDIVRAIHASSAYEIPKHQAETLDPTSIRLLIICDQERIPDALAVQVRRLGLLDLQITTFEDLVSGKILSGTIDLSLVLRTAGHADRDTSLYTRLLSRVKLDSTVLAAVQVDGEQTTLRAVQRGGFAAVARCGLNDDRLKRLLQICRN